MLNIETIEGKKNLFPMFSISLSVTLKWHLWGLSRWRRPRLWDLLGDSGLQVGLSYFRVTVALPQPDFCLSLFHFVSQESVLMKRILGLIPRRGHATGVQNFSGTSRILPTKETPELETTVLSLKAMWKLQRAKESHPFKRQERREDEAANHPRARGTGARRKGW